MLIFKNSLPNYCLPDAKDSDAEYFLKGVKLEKVSARLNVCEEMKTVMLNVITMFNRFNKHRM